MDNGRLATFLFTVDADWIPGSHRGLERLLDLCARLRAKATIFTTGKFALAYPDLIQGAHADGHEIGTHGWQHPMPATRFENYRLAPDAQRREWLSRATEAIAHVTSVEPRAFRAPFLWIDGRTFRLLEEFRYHIDSSIPTRRFDGLVGMVNYPHYFWAALEPYHPHLDRPHRRGNSSILEVPPSAYLLPLNMSTLRFLGLRTSLLLLRVLARRSPVLNFYCHPWEFVSPDDGLEFPADAPLRHRRGTGPHLLEPLGTFLEAVLHHGFRSGTVSEVAASAW